MTKTNTKAFTLVELLIVIVIIGILAVALIPRLTGAQASARDAARQASVQQIATAVASYLAENPTATSVDKNNLTSGGYLSSYPNGPKGDEYTINQVVDNGTTGYTICARVERTAKGNSSSITGTGNETSGQYYCQYIK